MLNFILINTFNTTSDHEIGSVVSRHRCFEAAQTANRRLQPSGNAYLPTVIYVVDAPVSVGEIVYSDDERLLSLDPSEF